MIYNLLLFLHIIGTILMFVSVGITITAMIAMLSEKKIETLSLWASLAVKVDGLIPFSIILILPPGLYLTFSTWGWGYSWINLSLALILLMSVTGPTINLPRLKAILAGVNAETQSFPSTHVIEKVRDRTLWYSVTIMTTLGVSIIFLMTVKPSLIGSVISIVTAIILGFMMANLLLRKASPSIEKNGSIEAR